MLRLPRSLIAFAVIGLDHRGRLLRIDGFIEAEMGVTDSHHENLMFLVSLRGPFFS
jgi:hypothetical protein